MANAPLFDETRGACRLRQAGVLARTKKQRAWAHNDKHDCVTPGTCRRRIACRHVFDQFFPRQSRSDGYSGSKAMKTAVFANIAVSLNKRGRLCASVLTAFGIGLAVMLGVLQEAVAEQDPVTAIDIALEPDATMLQHAKDANARLLKSFPKGFTLDETHHPHVTVLQQFVRTADLDKVFAAANAVLTREKPTAWTLKAFKYYYIPSSPVGLAGIVVEPTENLRRLQDELIKAVEPYTVETGTPAAFFSEDSGRDIQKSLIEYVAHFVYNRGGQAFQSACNDRRRNGDLSERDVGRTI